MIERGSLLRSKTCAIQFFYKKTHEAVYLGDFHKKWQTDASHTKSFYSFGDF